MADILNFKGKIAEADISDKLMGAIEDTRGVVAGAILVVVTGDNEVTVLCGPDLDSTMATLSKLQAILGSMYANNLYSV